MSEIDGYVSKDDESKKATEELTNKHWMDVVKKLSKYFINFCGGDFDRAFEFAQGLMAGKEVGFMTPKWKFNEQALSHICDECGLEYDVFKVKKDSVVVHLKLKNAGAKLIMTKNEGEN